MNPVGTDIWSGIVNRCFPPHLRRRFFRVESFFKEIYFASVDENTVLIIAQRLKRND